MATRSAIGVMDGNTVKAIYCHSDGYLSYVGKVLLAHYDSAKTNQLVAMGDMSMLGKNIGEKINFNDRMAYEGDNVATQCRFYGRDRGDTGIEFKTFSNEKELFDGIDAEYFYVLSDGVWYVSVGAEWAVLSEALAKESVIV